MRQTNLCKCFKRCAHISVKIVNDPAAPMMHCKENMRQPHRLAHSSIRTQFAIIWTTCNGTSTNNILSPYRLIYSARSFSIYAHAVLFSDARMYVSLANKALIANFAFSYTKHAANKRGNKMKRTEKKRYYIISFCVTVYCSQLQHNTFWQMPAHKCSYGIAFDCFRLLLRLFRCY